MDEYMGDPASTDPGHRTHVERTDKHFYFWCEHEGCHVSRFYRTCAETLDAAAAHERLPG